MKAITTNSNVRQGAEIYAKLHNISVPDAEEKCVTMLVDKFRQRKDEAQCRQLEYEGN